LATILLMLRTVCMHEDVTLRNNDVHRKVKVSMVTSRRLDTSTVACRRDVLASRDMYI